MTIREFIAKLIPTRPQRPPMPEGMTEAQQQLWEMIPEMSEKELRLALILHGIRGGSR